MTRKTYKSAMGKTVDLGALILENENTRAVGNMGVNARGDVLDSANRVIDAKNKQVTRQYKRQTNTANIPLTTSKMSAKKPDTEPTPFKTPRPLDEPGTPEAVEENIQPDEIIASPEPVEESVAIPRGGLAAAIAKAKEVKQELEKTPRQLAQERAGVKKI